MQFLVWLITPPPHDDEQGVDVQLVQTVALPEAVSVLATCEHELTSVARCRNRGWTAATVTADAASAVPRTRDRPNTTVGRAVAQVAPGCP